jgi:DNA-directed RNA polymerase subunit RPC12/RpoP
MPLRMARPQYVDCPICETDVALDGAKGGDEIFCGYCGAPIVLAKVTDDDEVEIEEY